MLTDEEVADDEVAESQDEGDEEGYEYGGRHQRQIDVFSHLPFPGAQVQRSFLQGFGKSLQPGFQYQRNVGKNQAGQGKDNRRNPGIDMNPAVEDK